MSSAEAALGMNETAIGRGGGIRTHDPLPPRQMRYQAALRPDCGYMLRTRNCTRAVGFADWETAQRRRICSTSSSSCRTCRTIWFEMETSILPCDPSRRWRAPVIVKPWS